MRSINLKNEEAMARVGSQRNRKKKKKKKSKGSVLLDDAVKC
jgi:hypothetical protein